MSQTSAQQKLLRGIEQIKTLRAETKTFEDDEAYVFRTEAEVRSLHEVVYRSFATERKAPSPTWPLLAGEALHNLRCALDHAVWSVASKRSRDRSQYPIFTDPCEFQVVGLRMLPGFPLAIRTLIEDTQPYRRLPQAPARDALELLRTLSNIDKHRTLTTFATAVKMEFVGTRQDIILAWQEYGTNIPLSHGEAKISEFTATSESEFEDMEVDPGFIYEIRVEGRPLDFLPVIARRVFEAVSACENGGMPSPFAAYPI